MILNKILEKTKEDLARRQKELPYELLAKSLSFNPHFPRDVIRALRSTPDDPLKIIAEVKRASPSKGIIRENFDHLEIAQAYEAGEAAALSVLTEPHWFKGDLEFLPQIRRYCSLPLLRKDFIIDKYQILEALIYGADFVLLIARALARKELKELIEFAWGLGMEALVEIHDKEDLTKAIFAGANIIGINHRNLETFEMDMELSAKLIPLIPNGKVIVAESGLTDHEQLVALNKIGVDAFLIGEHFMRQEDVTAALKKIKGIA
ncbi:MAG: indole-3-glycerol phosphate synthase TrpC [Campylobacterales bacterium]